MTRRSAVLAEECACASGATWRTLYVGGGADMEASYPSEAAGLADAPNWCAGVVEVVRLARPAGERAAG